MMDGKSGAPYLSVFFSLTEPKAAAPEGLWSLLTQTYPREKMEVIFIGSEENAGARSLIARFARLFPLAGMRVQHRPQGILHDNDCRGEVVLHLDPHRPYHPEFVAEYVKSLNPQMPAE